MGEVFASTSHQSDYSHLETRTEDVIEKPEFASTVGENFRHLPKTDLADILYGGKHILSGLQTSTGIAPQQKLFRVSFNILNISPFNLFEFTQLFCRACFRNYSFRDFTTANPAAASSVRCPHCQHVDLETVYKVIFTVKDKSLFNVP